MKTILLTFENESRRNEYLKLMHDIANGIDTLAPVKDLMAEALINVKLDPIVKSGLERQTALFVAGQKMSEGSLEELNKLFAQEITQHSGSVQIREMYDGEWRMIRQRPSR